MPPMSMGALTLMIALAHLAVLDHRDRRGVVEGLHDAGAFGRGRTRPIEVVESHAEGVEPRVVEEAAAVERVVARQLVDEGLPLNDAPSGRCSRSLRRDRRLRAPRRGRRGRPGCRSRAGSRARPRASRRSARRDSADGAGGLRAAASAPRRCRAHPSLGDSRRGDSGAPASSAARERSARQWCMVRGMMQPMSETNSSR